MASTSLMQQSGGFNTQNIQVIKSPYCNQVAGGAVVKGDTVYAISTYIDGVLNATATIYQNEDGDVLALTAPQIAALVAGQCDIEYDQEGELVCAAGITLKRIEIQNNSTGEITNDAPTVVFINPATNAVVAAPATFTFGACVVQKVPITARVYQSAVGAIAVPATAKREAIFFNRSNRDILVTWVGTLAGAGGTFTVPARGTYILTLVEEPNEAFFATMVTSLDLYGVGALGANELLIDFKN